MHPVASSDSTFYRAGELIACPGCERTRFGKKLMRVAPRSTGHARVIQSEADATPGSGIHRCHACRCFIEILIRPFPNPAQAA